MSQEVNVISRSQTIVVNPVSQSVSVISEQGPRGPQGEPGPEGPEGPQGASAAGEWAVFRVISGVIGTGVAPIGWEKRSGTSQIDRSPTPFTKIIVLKAGIYEVSPSITMQASAPANSWFILNVVHYTNPGTPTVVVGREVVGGASVSNFDIMADTQIFQMNANDWIECHVSCAVVNNVLDARSWCAIREVTGGTGEQGVPGIQGVQGVQGPPGSAVSPARTGEIIPVAGTIPADAVLCNGQALSRTSYANLFAKIGTTWGVGNGSTTFNVPDLRDRTLIGASATRAFGAVGGAATHVLTAAEMPVHLHPPGGITDAQGSHAHTIASIGDIWAFRMNFSTEGLTTSPTGMRITAGTMDAAGSHAHNLPNTANAGGGAAHNNMPPWAAINYAIFI